MAGLVTIPSFNQMVKKMILEDLDGLKLDGTVIDKYLQAIESGDHWDKIFNGWKKKEFIRIHYLLEKGPLNLPYSNKYRHYRSDIIGNFLLSTDFFINKMDESKEISFIGLFDPYTRPCSNPFSNLYYPLNV